MLKALLFDFDGTIADTLPVCINAFKATVEPVLGRKLTLDDVRYYFGPAEEGIFKNHFPDRYDELCQTYFDHYKRLQSEVPNTVPGIMELIRDVKDAGVRVALITAKGPGSCKISLDFYGIADEFEEIRVGGPDGRVKDVAIPEVLDKMGIEKDESVYVGDSYRDVVCARRAGVACWAAAWLETAELDRIHKNSPEKIFHTVDEMRRELEKEGVLK
ncbi:MAG: HAD family hydrolase [Thermoguttaceae bacterium]|jgi:phosphoglycolate phosphatase-like HAD superfamily hydrolase